MKILHVCLAAFYIDNYSYQENLLPKYHKKMGNEVYILASTKKFDEFGQLYYTDKQEQYTNENGIPVKRIINKSGSKIAKKLNTYKNVYEEVNAINPDVIFIHGVQFLSIREIVKFKKKNPKVQLLIDNHADFSNSAKNWFSKQILHKFLWKKMAKTVEPYTNRFFGVLPARVDFLKDVYGLSPKKIELLLMGGDDELIAQCKRADNKEITIITGGKIDKYKREILDLMKVVDDLRIPLTIFGTVSEDLLEEFNTLQKSKYINFVGWKSSIEIYELISTSKIAVFPGRHSVLWEETVAMGKPIVVKRWDGTAHVNINDNCLFLERSDYEEMKDVLLELINNENKLNKLEKQAKLASKNFLYSEIAKKSLESVRIR